MEPLKLKNYLLIPLAKWLMDQELPGRMSRSRNRFLDIIRPRFEEIENTRLELGKKHAKKDEKGNPIEIEQDGVKRFDMTDEGREAFRKDYTEYINEESVFDVTAANEADMKVVAKVVLETDEKFSDAPENPIATHYSEWCTAFEQAKLTPEQQPAA